MSGGSNQYIFNSLIEAKLSQKINKNDLVIIMWTQTGRHNFYDNRWKNVNRFYSDNNLDIDNYQKFQIDTFSSRGTIINDLSLLHAADILLSEIGCEYYFLSAVELTYYSDNNDIHNFYLDTLNKVKPSIFKTLFDCNWKNKKRKIKLPDEKLKKAAEEEKNKNIISNKKSYNSVAGSSWPRFEDYVSNNFKINNKILNEINSFKEKFGWNFQSNYDNIELLYDLHPLPLEHMEYLQKIFPDIIISDVTKNWVKTKDDAVFSSNDNSSQQINTLVKRW